jgi:DNA polymerase-3 subunit chi
MSEIRFYHLTRTRLEVALPELLEKTLERNWRAVVMTGSSERAEHLAELLWTYRGESFLPHGTAKDGCAENQPIWLTAADETPNGAEVLFLTEGAASNQMGAYRLICELFDGNDPSAVAAARVRWTAYKEDGHEMSYWKQSEKGWAKEA